MTCTKKNVFPGAVFVWKPVWYATLMMHVQHIWTKKDTSKTFNIIRVKMKHLFCIYTNWYMCHVKWNANKYADDWLISWFSSWNKINSTNISSRHNVVRVCHRISCKRLSVKFSFSGSLASRHVVENPCFGAIKNLWTNKNIMLKQTSSRCPALSG